MRATYAPSTSNFEIWTKASDPLPPLRATVVFKFEPFMTPDFRSAILGAEVSKVKCLWIYKNYKTYWDGNVLETRKVVKPLVDCEGNRRKCKSSDKLSSERHVE